MSEVQTRPHSLTKPQWLNEFALAFERTSMHFMSDRSVRAIALQQWESHQGVDPAEAARRWSSGISRAK